MKFRSDFLRRYLAVAPAALAVERAVECEILQKQSFVRPILDIGCGDGIFAEILFDEEIDTGIDLDPAEIARAKKLNAYSELIVCPGDAIPKPDQTFNTILSNSVLEHIPNLVPVLREAHRLLAPGGTFLVTIPTDRLEHNSAPARLFGWLGLKRLELRYRKFHNSFWRHYNVCTSEGWRDVFNSAGFEVTDHYFYASPDFSSFYDLLMPFAVPSIAAKKIFGRWLLFPSLRKYYFKLIYMLIARMHRNLKQQPGSSLVFFKLKRA